MGRLEQGDAAGAAVNLARASFWQGESLTARVIDEANMLLRVGLFRAPAVNRERRGDWGEGTNKARYFAKKSGRGGGDHTRQPTRLTAVDYQLERSGSCAILQLASVAGVSQGAHAGRR